MAATLVPKYGDDYPIPRRTMRKGDNSKSIRELGMTYRPLAETMNDFFQQVIDSGRFEKT